MNAQVKNIKEIINERSKSIKEGCFRLKEIKEILGNEVKTFVYNDFWDDYKGVIGFKGVNKDFKVEFFESSFVKSVRNNDVILIEDLSNANWNKFSFISNFLTNMVKDGFILVEGEKVSVDLSKIYYIG